MISLPTDERVTVTRWMRRRWLVAGGLISGAAVLFAISWTVLNERDGSALRILAGAIGLIATVWTSRTAILDLVTRQEWSRRAIVVEHQITEGGRPIPRTQVDDRIHRRGRQKGTLRFELVQISEQVDGVPTPDERPEVHIRSLGFPLPGPLSKHTSSAWVVGSHGRRVIVLASSSRPRVFHRPVGPFERRLDRALPHDRRR